MPDYDAMADDYAPHPPTADEVLGTEIGPAALKTGRPHKGAAEQGRTPTMSVRLPGECVRRSPSEQKLKGSPSPS